MEAGGDGCFFFLSFLCCWPVFGGGVNELDSSSAEDEDVEGRAAWPGAENWLCNISSEVEFLLPSVVEYWEAMTAERKSKGSFTEN